MNLRILFLFILSAGVPLVAWAASAGLRHTVQQRQQLELQATGSHLTIHKGTKAIAEKRYWVISPLPPTTTIASNKLTTHLCFSTRLAHAGP